MNNIQKKTNEQFLIELGEKHPTLTALDEYVNSRTKIHLRCNVCGYILFVQPLSLYMGHGCANCGGTRKKTHEEFVEELAIKAPHIEVLGTYKGCHTPIEVKCKKCGRISKITPGSLLKHGGCSRCSGIERKTKERFIEEMKIINPYIEIVGDYINNYTPIEYYCKICETTSFAKPHTLLKTGGCNHLKWSRGEEKIAKWLSNNNIEYIKEYSYQDCKDIMPLPFDFYIPKNNILIEYDGEQHYKSVKMWGGDNAFEKRKLHDSIKTKYCLDNKIKLLRIPYWDFDNIDEILNSELKKNNKLIVNSNLLVLSPLRRIILLSLLRVQ